MKKLILLMLVLAPALLFAQQKFTIIGNIGKVDAPAKIYLDYEISSDRTGVSDSTTLVNGVFKFSGEVKNITQARLLINYSGLGKYSQTPQKGRMFDLLVIYLVNGTTALSSPDSLWDAKATGTKVNEDLQRYYAFIQPATITSKALRKEYEAAPAEKRDTKEFGDYINKKEKVIEAQSEDLTRQFITANRDSYISLVMLKLAADGAYPDYAVVGPLYDKLSPSVRATAEGVAYGKYLDTLKTLMAGALAPDFAEPDTNGKMVSLSSFRGKYVFLDFWASWCGGCRLQNPNVLKAYNKFKDKNFTVLSVSFDRPGKKDLWLQAIHEDHLTWTQISDLKFWSNAAAKLYGLTAIPQNVLIDPDGKIVARNLFDDDLENKLAQVLGKP